LRPRLRGRSYRQHLAAVDLETLAELNVGFVDQLLKQRLAFDEPQFSEIITIEVKQVEGDHYDLGRSTLQFILQHRKIRAAVSARCDDFAIDNR
jgi:hypothetical protein